MGPAILIASGSPGDALHDRAFSHAPARPKVAWIGAANSDSTAPFGRAAEAFARRYGAEVRHARSIGAGLDLDATRDAIASADVLYLAGGDVRQLAERLSAHRLDEAIRARHAAGAVTIGLSAGAIGLTRSWVAFPEDEEEGERPFRFPCVGALPQAIDVHDEESDWEELRALLAIWAADEPDAVVDAYGILAGGALEVTDGGVAHVGPPPKRLRLDRGRIIE